MKKSTALKAMSSALAATLCTGTLLSAGTGDGTGEAGFVAPPREQKKPPAPPRVASSAETVLACCCCPVTPMSRTEAKKPPQPPVLITKIKEESLRERQEVEGRLPRLPSMLGSIANRLAVAWIGLVVSGLHLHAAADWQVAEATIRYKLGLTKKPTHPTAGYYVELPDGGILHGATPATVVVGEDGKTIPSYLLWSNSESGFSMVFADPGGPARSVSVYILPGGSPRLWRPDTGLTPSAILCTWPGHENLGAAQALAKLGRVEPTVHSAPEPGNPRAPFCIGGDDSGRPRPAAFYLLSYLNPAVAGKYWIAPFIRNGQGEVLIDGNKLNPTEHSKLWGGTGAYVDLTRGLHRVEVFQTAPGAGPYSSEMHDGGLMYLTWRSPNEKLRGVDSRVVAPFEIVRSGGCNLTSVEARDGGPVAVASARAIFCYWFEQEEPLLLYELSALEQGQPAGATWSWSFPEGGTVEGAKTRWIFPGLRESKVKLTVKTAQGASTCELPFFAFGTPKTSLERADHRKAFRDVLAVMLETFPRNPDPVAGWSEAWWNNLLRTIDGGQGYPLLLRLFTDHLDVARRKLAPAQLHTLEDLFLDLTLRENPAASAGWIQKFLSGAFDAPRQNELKMREGELQMYYLGDHKQAEAIFTTLAGFGGPLGARAKIRLGDLAFMAGDLNKATSFYADIQNRARALRNAGSAFTNPFSQPAAGAPSQKGGALQEVSLSENVRTLTDEGYLLEAREALLTWENEFPLSKISGDYILRESDLYIAMHDWKRAQPMLEAYCREIDASSFLPDAASLLMSCVTGAKEPPASIRDIIEKVKGRLKYHPIATQLDAFLATAGKPAK